MMIMWYNDLLLMSRHMVCGMNIVKQSIRSRLRSLASEFNEKKIILWEVLGSAGIRGNLVYTLNYMTVSSQLFQGLEQCLKN